MPKRVNASRWKREGRRDFTIIGGYYVESVNEIGGMPAFFLQVRKYSFIGSVSIFVRQYSYDAPAYYCQEYAIIITISI